MPEGSQPPFRVTAFPVIEPTVVNTVSKEIESVEKFNRAEEPSNIWAQLHYKFGIGIRVGERLYAIPSVEIPILNGWKWEDGRSTLGAFNSRYRPVIISVRFAWLTIPKCPKVWDNDPSTKNGGGM